MQVYFDFDVCSKGSIKTYFGTIVSIQRRKQIKNNGYVPPALISFQKKSLDVFHSGDTSRLPARFSLSLYNWGVCRSRIKSRVAHRHSPIRRLFLRSYSRKESTFRKLNIKICKCRNVSWSVFNTFGDIFLYLSNEEKAIYYSQSII